MRPCVGLVSGSRCGSYHAITARQIAIHNFAVPMVITTGPHVIGLMMVLGSGSARRPAFGTLALWRSASPASLVLG